ncbi:MAG: T9SS type A sorting domain-containing protein [bacterium]
MKKITLLLYLFIAFLSLSAQTDGTLDTSFLPNNSGLKGAQGPVFDILEQPDGKLYLAGQFQSYEQIEKRSLVRLFPDGSMDESFNQTNFTASGAPPRITSIALQTDGKLLVGGNFEVNTGSPNFDIIAQDLMRLNADGTFDNTFIAPESISNCGDIEDLLVQPDGKIIVVGNITFCLGSTIDNNENILRLNTDGTLDETFQVKVNGFTIEKAILQSDGKIVVGGIFDDVNGQSRENIARINADGSLDTTFEVGSGFDDDVEGIALQPDGKLIVVGDFTAYDGATANKVIRLNTDGSVDNTFNSGDGTGQYFPSADTTSSRDIAAVTLQPDGKILIGGKFNRYNGSVISKVARLNVDGSIDNTFNAVDDEGTSTGDVLSLFVKADNKIVVGGSFSNLMQRRLRRITQLNTNGTIDTDFNKTYGPLEGSSGTTIVNRIKPDVSSGYFVTGQFREYDDIRSRNIAKINADGTLDNSFSTGNTIFNGFDDDVYDFVVQPDGKVVVVGEFENYNQIPAPGIVRLNTDGSIDGTFNVGTGVNTSSSARINNIVLQPDGKLLISGFFVEFNDTPLQQFGRLNPDGSIDTTLNTGTGVNNVDAIFLLSNGQIILSDISTYNGTAIPGKHARIDADGTLDMSFNTSEILNGEAYSLTELPNGQFMIAGFFGSQSPILKLNSDGSIDNTFNATSIMQTTNSNGIINDIEVQADGKVIIGGDFNTVNGRTLRGLARLNTDGSLDESFNPEDTDLDAELYSGFGPFSEVYDLFLEDSGRLLVVGQFGFYNTERKTPVIAVFAGEPSTLSNPTFQPNEIDFQMYPNPANATVHIRNTSLIDDVTILDYSGRIVKHLTSLNSAELALDISDLANGIYLVNITQGNSATTKKLIIK